jgi:translation initiation factor 2 beta subunit (eIF-2beta)/eIF-5
VLKYLKLSKRPSLTEFLTAFFTEFNGNFSGERFEVPKNCLRNFWQQTVLKNFGEILAVLKRP